MVQDKTRIQYTEQLHVRMYAWTEILAACSHSSVAVSLSLSHSLSSYTCSAQTKALSFSDTLAHTQPYRPAAASGEVVF